MSRKSNFWEIIDKNGTIHGGSEEAMRMAFDAMILTTEEMMGTYNLNSSQAERIILEYDSGWEGDLKLVEIHDIHK